MVGLASIYLTLSIYVTSFIDCQIRQSFLEPAQK